MASFTIRFEDTPDGTTMDVAMDPPPGAPDVDPAKLPEPQRFGLRLAGVAMSMALEGLLDATSADVMAWCAREKSKQVALAMTGNALS